MVNSVLDELLTFNAGGTSADPELLEFVNLYVAAVDARTPTLAEAARAMSLVAEMTGLERVCVGTAMRDRTSRLIGRAVFASALAVAVRRTG